MKYLALIYLFVSTFSYAQANKVSVGDHSLDGRIEAVQNDKGQLIFRSYDLKGQVVTLSQGEGLERLKRMAKVACAVSPSSITVSAGIISLTWEKSEICKD